MYNYKLIVEYDGLKFNGWQKQNYTENTIQHQIEKAIGILLKSEIKLTGAGRTDSKVSAYNQIANFYSEVKINKNIFLKSVNSILPDTVTVKKITNASADFHSRYSAKKREYLYYIATAKKSISGDHCYRINYLPDFSKIESFMEFIKSVKKFRSLCKNKTDRFEFHCDIYEFKYRYLKSKNEIIFKISASRFLHSMVRAVIGCTLDIGRGKSDPVQISKLILKGEKFRIHYLPGNALFLNKIYY
ncbi:MAG: hypothetical protein IPL16_02000 [Ignavibacteria bacterium]|nr:hypothetical protein [Ignavibacteria bacterium]